ncbi:glutamyl-tRNA reductase-binding protein, chloroplastic isoform X2 [Cryptomeria japonica]|uniref:glutamyl-tRNA reductase-binding protein, chloroplastic isoform X2 n=1 Tax=Cryptomeria japonica TaxID=3369 RepID=UPI0027DAA5D4|nr:glutamyl-tRNA reductase-binding protein, chloroplastic isoform X2 [Cryptomeria japonica]
MSYTVAYKSILIPHHIGHTQRVKNAFATISKASFLYQFPELQSKNGSWSKFRTSPSPVKGSLRAFRCNSSVSIVENNTSDASITLQTRPSPAETCRTLMELCLEGTLCTLAEDGWPFGTGVEFAVDVQGMPVIYLDPLSVLARHVLLNKCCSLHVQPRCRKAQCTLIGSLSRQEDKKLKQRLQLMWARRFGKEVNEDHLYVLAVERILQSQDLCEEGLWVNALDYSRASADPLRDRVANIVKDMNDKHLEDIHRICNIYTDLDAEIEEASMIWIDRLGFDLSIRTHPQREILEVRIPFPREVTDEKDAKSSLTYMAQIAWEVEKNYAPLDFERVKCMSKLR